MIRRVVLVLLSALIVVGLPAAGLAQNGEGGGRINDDFGSTNYTPVEDRNVTAEVGGIEIKEVDIFGSLKSGKSPTTEYQGIIFKWVSQNFIPFLEVGWRDGTVPLYDWLFHPFANYVYRTIAAPTIEICAENAGPSCERALGLQATDGNISLIMILIPIAGVIRFASLLSGGPGQMGLKPILKFVAAVVVAWCVFTFAIPMYNYFDMVAVASMNALGQAGNGSSAGHGFINLTAQAGDEAGEAKNNMKMSSDSDVDAPCMDPGDDDDHLGHFVRQAKAFRNAYVKMLNGREDTAKKQLKKHIRNLTSDETTDKEQHVYTFNTKLYEYAREFMAPKAAMTIYAETFCEGTTASTMSTGSGDKGATTFFGSDGGELVTPNSANKTRRRGSTASYPTGDPKRPTIEADDPPEVNHDPAVSAAARFIAYRANEAIIEPDLSSVISAVESHINMLADLSSDYDNKTLYAYTGGMDENLYTDFPGLSSDPAAVLGMLSEIKEQKHSPEPCREWYNTYFNDRSFPSRPSIKGFPPSSEANDSPSGNPGDLWHHDSDHCLGAKFVRDKNGNTDRNAGKALAQLYKLQLKWVPADYAFKLMAKEYSPLNANHVLYCYKHWKDSGGSGTGCHSVTNAGDRTRNAKNYAEYIWKPWMKEFAKDNFDQIKASSTKSMMDSASSSLPSMSIGGIASAILGPIKMLLEWVAYLISMALEFILTFILGIFFIVLLMVYAVVIALTLVMPVINIFNSDSVWESARIMSGYALVHLVMFGWGVLAKTVTFMITSLMGTGATGTAGAATGSFIATVAATFGSIGLIGTIGLYLLAAMGGWAYFCYMLYTEGFEVAGNLAGRMGGAIAGTMTGGAGSMALSGGSTSTSQEEGETDADVSEDDEEDIDQNLEGGEKTGADVDRKAQRAQDNEETPDVLGPDGNPIRSGSKGKSDTGKNEKEKAAEEASEGFSALSSTGVDASAGDLADDEGDNVTHDSFGDRLSDSLSDTSVAGAAEWFSGDDGMGAKMKDKVGGAIGSAAGKLGDMKDGAKDYWNKTSWGEMGADALGASVKGADALMTTGADSLPGSGLGAMRAGASAVGQVHGLGKQEVASSHKGGWGHEMRKAFSDGMDVDLEQSLTDALSQNSDAGIEQVMERLMGDFDQVQDHIEDQFTGSQKENAQELFNAVQGMVEKGADGDVKAAQKAVGELSNAFKGEMSSELREFQEEMKAKMDDD